MMMPCILLVQHLIGHDMRTGYVDRLLRWLAAPMQGSPANMGLEVSLDPCLF
jgi:hypothetical protein